MLSRWMSLLTLPPMLLLGACATVTKGTDQTVAVITDPPGSACELSREGNTIAVINPTPGSVSLEKDKDTVIVRCEKAGHFDGMETLASSFQGMTFGNVIFGGVIGVGVDAASGAMHHYPPNVTVVLPPRRFVSAEARDAFFDRQASRIETEAKAAIAEVRKTCHSSDDVDGCKASVEAVEVERDAKLQALADQRKAAAVD